MATLKHQVIDNITADKLFTIDPVTRQITNEGGKKQNLIQYDHNSERFTFVAPDTVEGHDMTKCDAIQIHAVNIDAKTRQESRELYLVTEDIIHDSTNKTISFSWLISGRCTQYVGDLTFLVRFVCTGADGNPIYIWNTAPCSTFKILAGLNNTDEIVNEFADVIIKLQEALESGGIVDLKQTASPDESGGVNTWELTLSDGKTKTVTVKNGKQGQPGTPGKSAYEIAKGDSTTFPSEADWIKSLQGKSAYEIAKAKDPTLPSNEAEWAATLQVPQFYKVTDDGSTKKLNKVSWKVDGTRLKITTS